MCFTNIYNETYVLTRAIINGDQKEMPVPRKMSSKKEACQNY